MGTPRRLLPWISVGTLLLLAVGAGLGSAMTAPHPTSATAPSTTSPEPSCPAPEGSSRVTLSDMAPSPTITVSVGAILVAMVPAWPGEQATEINIVNPTVLDQTCTVLLPDGGRRAVLYAVRAGQTLLTATVTPPTEAMMPAWSASVTVTGTNPPPPAGALSTVIDLPATTLVAGSAISGALGVTNRTDRTINLNRGCQPQWAVGLRSPSIPFTPIFPAVCSTAPFLLQPGTNHLPFMLQASYHACTNGRSGSSPTLPLCVDGEPPPLPPGAYQAVLGSTSSALSTQPVDVEVVGMVAPSHE